MNKVILIGRLTKDTETRVSQGDNPTYITRYTLAVDRRFKKDGEPSADFINCVAFGKSAEFAEKYFFKGMKVAITGRLQSGNYTNKEGQKVYTTDVVIEEQEFAESKQSNEQHHEQSTPSSTVGDGFMKIQNGELEEILPFN